MTETAHTQIQRLVSLIAWMSQRDTGKPVRYRDAARQLGIAEAVLRADLQVLLDLTETYKPCLGSLSVAITAGGFVLSSRGAFQRPFRLSRDEALALMLGLIGVQGGRDFAARLGAQFSAEPDVRDVERTWATGPTPGERVAQVLSIARRARDDKRKLELLYCGSAGDPSRRVVHPHQVVQDGGAWYVVAWCEKSSGSRTFRVERILEVAELDDHFTPHPAVRRVRGRRDLLSVTDAPTATVSFAKGIARWARERYPGGEDARDGSYRVKFPVADPRWLVREVLQYGAGAEVVEPEAMRQFVRGLVG
jgi:proteasome accessory factor C